MRVPVIGRLGPLASVLEFVATAAPGVKEILTVGKVCWEVRESIERRADWDIVIVDAAATGHVVAQLDSPRAIRELVQVGPVRAQTEWMAELLADPAITALNLVTSPEEMPVSETIELVATARERLDVPLGMTVVNRVLPEPFTRSDEPIFDALRATGHGGRAGGCRRPRRRGGPRRCRARVGHAAIVRRCTSRGCGSRSTSRSSTCRISSCAITVFASLASSPTRSPTELGHDAACCCERNASVDARGVARDARDRRVLRVGRRRQDDDRGRDRACSRTACSAARCSCSPSIRRKPTRERTRPRGHRQRRAARARRGASRRPASTARGELYAAMLDTKASRGTISCCGTRPNEETAYRILENRLYHNLTGRFVQSHDYIAMERLYDLHASGTYDLIVIDTPPTRNAIDFLEAPARMADFFGGRLLRWLTMPYRVGGKRGARHRQLREQALLPDGRSDPRQPVPPGHRASSSSTSRRCTTASSSAARAVERLLHDRRTTFAVVTTLEGAPLREAEFFCDELTDRGLPPRRARAQQDAARLAPERRWRAEPRRRLLADAPTVADKLADQRGRRARRSRARRRVCCGPCAAIVPRLLDRRDARGRAPRRAGAPPRCRRRRPRTRGRRPRRRRTRGDRRAPPRRAPIAASVPCSCPWRSRCFELARRNTGLSGEPLRHAQRLVASWQPLADLCFSDLLLLAPVAGRGGPPLRRPRPRAARPPARRSTRPTWSGRSSRRSSARSWPGRGARARSSAATRRSSGRGSGRGCSASRCVPRRAADRRRDPRERRRRSGRRPGELERLLPRRVRPLRPHDRRGHASRSRATRWRPTRRPASATA